MSKEVEIPCKCGHSMYGHYMCGGANEMPCFTCKCPQFKPRNGVGVEYEPRSQEAVQGRAE